MYVLSYLTKKTIIVVIKALHRHDNRSVCVRIISYDNTSLFHQRAGNEENDYGFMGYWWRY